LKCLPTGSSTCIAHGLELAVARRISRHRPYLELWEAAPSVPCERRETADSLSPRYPQNQRLMNFDSGSPRSENLQDMHSDLPHQSGRIAAAHIGSRSILNTLARVMFTYLPEQGIERCLGLAPRLSSLRNQVRLCEPGMGSLLYRLAGDAA
jgi:hypothetical protein